MPQRHAIIIAAIFLLAATRSIAQPPSMTRAEIMKLVEAKKKEVANMPHGQKILELGPAATLHPPIPKSITTDAALNSYIKQILTELKSKSGAFGGCKLTPAQSYCKMDGAILQLYLFNHY